MDHTFKFWMSLGRCIAFTEDDSHINRVWPKSETYEKNKHVDLMPRFMQADNLNAARRKAHTFIDQMFDLYSKADQSSTIYPPPPPPVVEIPLDQMTSFTIEGSAPPVQSSTDLTLNLNDLLK